MMEYLFGYVYKRVKNKISLQDILEKYRTVKLTMYKDDQESEKTLYLCYPDMKVFYPYNGGIYEMAEYQPQTLDFLQKILSFSYKIQLNPAGKVFHSCKE